jgi:CSLREA domain-containing protein
MRSPRRRRILALTVYLIGVGIVPLPLGTAWGVDTATPTPTDTPTVMSSDTATPAPTDTPTVASSDTPTETVTITAVLTATPTQTPTPSATPTPNGATITVNTTADNTTARDGRCTLREAVANVNAAADTTGGDCVGGTGAGDTIDFHLALPAKIKLSMGQLTLAQNVTITGPTTGELRIDGQNDSRIFEITASAVSISELIIQKGTEWTADGGGILVDVGAGLTLTNCVLSSNASANGFGGGLSNRGTATLINCTCNKNKAGFAAEAPVGNFGGGIFNSGTATLTLINCTLHHNVGGGLDNFGGSVSLRNCALSGNRAFRGGGVGNYGGTATLTGCTVSGNRAVSGGGFGNFGGTVILSNCTLSGNLATKSSGGGIFNSGGTAMLTNCTLSRNRLGRGHRGAGIYNLGVATLTNTVIASSPKSINCAGAAITSNGHNLSSDATCFTGNGTDLIETDPMLAALANFGGPTATQALCTGPGTPFRSCKAASPAIDTGDDDVTGPPDRLTTDQRGEPRWAGLHPDIGAYETQ